MLDITQLYSSLSAQATPESRKPGPSVVAFSPTGCTGSLRKVNPKPFVTWRITRSCNANCLNCYYDSRPRQYRTELSTSDALKLISDLANFQVSRLLLAGGEPLMRRDLLDLVAYAHQRGIETSLLTNGTLLTSSWVSCLQRAGLHSVTIMLEGMGNKLDRHRGIKGAFDALLQGYANCVAAGLAVEIRTPLTHWTYPDLARLLDFAERQCIRHMVFAHLVYAGRGNSPQDDMTHDEKRGALDLILERVEDFHRRGMGIRISTDDNVVDGIYVYLRIARQHPEHAAAAFRKLQECESGLDGAGVGLAGIDSVGDVHPDVYWADYILGNVRERPFSEIWEKSADPLLRGLRDRLPLLMGRCANCRWKQACGGSLRVRAQEVFGDPWMSDPACYLTEEEIVKEVTEQADTMEDDVLLPKRAA